MSRTHSPITTDDLKKVAVAAIEQRRKEIIAIATTILRNPETGFTERETSRLVRRKLRSMGIPFRSRLALTGVKGVVEGRAGPGPTVAVIGEMDALKVQLHPNRNRHTGAAHACGHHCQIASMLGAMVGITTPEVLAALSGRIVPFAVPAEELIEVEERMRLRQKRKIEFMGGKQELIRLGEFDDVDMAMLCHTSVERSEFTLGGTSNAHVVKYVQFIGRGAHAGGAPHLGVNALNAATFALSAINANRETFREADVVRVHGIMTHGGEAVSAIPAATNLEWRVRSANLDALAVSSAKVDRCFKAGALAVGAKVRITNIPGYMPVISNPNIQNLFYRNAVNVVGRSNVKEREPNHNGGGSTDMGDLSQLLPLIHPYTGGVTGKGHGADYVVKDYEQAVINPAKAMAMTVIDLLANGAILGAEVLAETKQTMTKDQYIDIQRKRAEVIEFDGARE